LKCRHQLEGRKIDDDAIRRQKVAPNASNNSPGSNCRGINKPCKDIREGKDIQSVSLYEQPANIIPSNHFLNFADYPEPEVANLEQCGRPCT
jgi:hypothetical protein